MKHTLFYLSTLVAFSISSCKKNPNACFTSDKTTASKNQNINFNSCAENEEEIQWNFGDGGSSIGKSVSHSYTSAGVYSVTQTVINSKGSDQNIQSITILENDPCANVTCLNGGVCIDGSCNCPDGFTGPNCGTIVNNDPCQGIVCLNGGTCANGLCNCPTGYTGSDCSISIPLSSITITKIVISNYPMTTSGGAGWDLDGGPDVFLTFAQGTYCATASGTSTINNATGATLTYNTQVSLNIPNSNYSICLYDDDLTSGNDYMAGVNFNPFDFKNGYPSSFVLQTADLTMRVYVTWNF